MEEHEILEPDFDDLEWYDEYENEIYLEDENDREE